MVDVGIGVRKRDDLDAFATPRPLVGDKANDTLGAAGPEMANDEGYFQTTQLCFLHVTPNPRTVALDRVR